MFHRGQRIIITESLATGKTHPAVGDIGYLNNMYLFYKHRFILADAFFSNYKIDLVKGKFRCERKRFVIDLGMSNNLKRRMLISGLKRKFYIGDEARVNLFSVGYFDAGRSLFETPPLKGGHGIFYTDKSQKLIKIPIVNIKAAPGRYSLMERPPVELDAWIRCMTPILNAHLLLFNHLKIQKLFNEIDSAFYVESQGDYEIFKIDWTIIGPNMRERVISTLRKIQSFSDLYVADLDLLHAKDFGSNCAASSTTKSAWSNKGIFSLIDLITKADSTASIIKFRIQCTISIVLRALLFSQYAYKNIAPLAYSLPWTETSLTKKMDIFKNIRKEVDDSSAALARIYEEKLLV